MAESKPWRDGPSAHGPPFAESPWGTWAGREAAKGKGSKGDLSESSGRRPGPRLGLRQYRHLARYPLRQWRVLLVLVVLAIGSAAVATLHPWPMKVLADYALGDVPTPLALRSVLDAISLSPTPTVLVGCAAAATLALFVLSSTVGAALSWTYILSTQRIMYDLAGDVFQRLQRSSLVSHAGRLFGDSLSRLTIDTRNLSSGVLSFLAPLQQVVMLLLIAVIAWNLDRVLAAVLLSVAPPTALLGRFLGGRVRGRAAYGRQAQSRVMSFVHQTLGAIPVVKSFVAEQRNTERFRLLSDDAAEAVRKMAMVNSVLILATNSAFTVAHAVVLYVGAVRVTNRDLSIGTLLVFLGYVRRVQLGSDMLVNAYSKIKEAAASADRVLELLEAEETVRDLPGARPLESRPYGHVRIEDVTFGYEADQPVLEEVTVEARPGETVALVGPTGAGKSTLVSLIPRFFDPWSGRVSIDGTDVRDLTLASLRSHVSLVLQEPFLLPLSVADNIAYGRPEATKDEIVAAAVAANADGFIRNLPEGYDTVIDERGGSLSGGERQRLTIARALLKDAPVLILDEPTSALDAQTEASILEALERLVEGRTTFVIAHRLSTVRRADRIVVLDQGRVVEVGSHEELLAADGIYQQMHALQAGAEATA